MSLRSAFNPCGISSNFRFQFDIEKTFNQANELLKKPEELTSENYVNIALAYMEAGDKEKTIQFAEQVLKIETNKAPDKQNYALAAKAYYILATIFREVGELFKANLLLSKAFQWNWDIWLTTNLHRCAGITLLKQKEFARASYHFNKACMLVANDKYFDLQDSLPALRNYYVLASAKLLFKKDNISEEEIQHILREFQSVTELYQAKFKERKISPQDQLKSHDWQSHQFHRGMVLCELAEKCAAQHVAFDPAQKEAVLALLLAAYNARVANRADDQRLSDVCEWVARAHQLLGHTENADQYQRLAKHHAARHKVICTKIVETKTELEIVKKSAEVLPISPDTTFSERAPGSLSDSAHLSQGGSNTLYSSTSQSRFAHSSQVRSLGHVGAVDTPVNNQQSASSTQQQPSRPRSPFHP